MIHHRLAHRLHELGVPLIARIVAELAHGATGIDIHPGARIGSHFFIDHGTGVVIGETAVIGNNVRIYQAVTLGAKRFETDADGALHKGGARHPIVEDDVVIYAGATVLGRVTIGRGASIGGNVWLTRSVPPGSRIAQASARDDRVEDHSAKVGVRPYRGKAMRRGPVPRGRAAAASRRGGLSGRSRLRLDCAVLLAVGARARTRCAPAALHSNSWRESVHEARCARRPHPCGARRPSTPAPAGRSRRSPRRLGSLDKYGAPCFCLVLASSGHRGRDDARGHRLDRGPGLTRIADRHASALVVMDDRHHHPRHSARSRGIHP